MNFREGPLGERRIARAIRTIEQQIEELRLSEDEDRRRQREMFYDLMDRASNGIFEQVEGAARKGQREFLLAKIPAFRVECDNIFALGAGLHDDKLLQDWLRERDLAHIFSAENQRISW